MKTTFCISAVAAAAAALASSYTCRCLAEGFTNEPRIIAKAASMVFFIASLAVLSVKAASAMWRNDMTKAMSCLGAATIAAVATLVLKFGVVL